MVIMCGCYCRHLQRIDDKSKQYYSRFDFFETTLMKGVMGGPGGGLGPFNVSRRHVSALSLLLLLLC